MIQRLHHVGIVTANMEDAIRYYVETFGCPPPQIVRINKPGIKFQSAMVSVGASHVQLIAPEIGLGVEELKKAGEGTILEVAFEVDDIEDFHQQMKLRGIEPVNLLGQPIDTKFLVASSGNRYFYLPKPKTRGTNIEIIQVMLQPS